MAGEQSSCRIKGGRRFARSLPLGLPGASRALAQKRINAERPSHTLDATALVHEVWLKLIGNERKKPWENRAHFYSAAAEAMCQVLLDHAKAKGRAKRGGGVRRAPLSVTEVAETRNFEETMRIDDAIRRLMEMDGSIGEVVWLRFFAGMSIEEAAAIGVSQATQTITKQT